MKQIITLLVVAVSILSCKKSSEDTPPQPQKTQVHSSADENKPPAQPTATADTSTTTKNLPTQTAKEIARDMGMDLNFDSPEDFILKLTKTIQQTHSTDDAKNIIRLIGNHNFTPAQHSALTKLIENNSLKLDPIHPFEKIGDLKPNKHSRWAINLVKSPPIILDILRQKNGKWQPSVVILPDPTSTNKKQLPNVDTDALNFTHTFLKTLLSQDFINAKKMVDHTKISDAKLAGLCIIFEEAAYKINPTKPLRALFIRDTAAGFYANITSSSDNKPAQFSIITQRDTASDHWRIHEINLDKLLGDYAKRLSGGDIYYSPLLKNPSGGDTLVIYFEFDSEGLTARTEKQLAIVTSLLKTDTSKSITISGFTDAKGSKEYNLELSQKRAESVKSFFANHGVSPEQVTIEAHGSLHPRLPNTQNDGSDNPSGRRANRRSEIYLDF